MPVHPSHIDIFNWMQTYEIEMMTKKYSLVTGGAGFMGSHVVDELLKCHHDVVALDDLSGGFRDNVSNEARFVEGSILDTDLINQLFETHDFDYVFHLAAYAAEGLSHFIRRFNYENNLIGSVNLLNASIKHEIKCSVFTSSIAVYGQNQLPMVESLTPQPEDPYGISKYAVELDLKAARSMYDLNYIIFRPHNVYGERQNIGDKYRNVIGIFMNQFMQDQPLTIFGDGAQTRAFSYIGDLAPIMAKSIELKSCYNDVFNIGSDHPYSVSELAKIVGQTFGLSNPKITYCESRNEVVHAYSDHEKIKEVLGLKESTSLEEGIKKMYTWANVHGPRTTPPFHACRLNLQVQNRSCPSFLWAFYILSIFSAYYSVTPQPSSTERSCGQQSRFSSGKTGEANHSYFRCSLFAKGFSLQQRKWGLLFFSVV